MKHWVVLAGILATFFAWPHSTQAAVPIYRPAAGPSFVQVVPAEVQALTPRERETIQPNYSYHALFTPNDPHYPLQWNFSAINIPGAWEADQSDPPYGGDPGVVVAVLDTGLSFENYQTHKLAPDLAGTSVWTNPGEIAGDGLDNDSNGYTDDVRGWNFLDHTGHPNDDYGHGTHIAAVIAAGTDNSIAAAGIAFRTTIMPLKVLDQQGNGSTLTIAEAIDYAVMNGADIINLSLGGEDSDPILEQAVTKAVAAGIVVVAASGNDGHQGLNYPARYANVIAVGGTQYDSNRAPYSNYGSGLDFMAPGGNVDLDQNGDGQPDGIAEQTCIDTACSTFGTFWYSGTSQAAAHVSAVAALLEACGVSGAGINGVLQKTVSDLGAAGYDPQYGWGLINAQAALASAGCTSSAPQAVTGFHGIAGATAAALLISDQSYPYTQPLFTWSASADGVYQVRWGKKGAMATASTQTTTTFRPTVNKEGTYVLQVSAVNSQGQESARQTFIYRYRPTAILIGSNNSISVYDNAFKRRQSVSVNNKTVRTVRALGGLVERNGTARMIIATDTAGGGYSIFSAAGKKLRAVKPFGEKFSGGVEVTLLNDKGSPPVIVAAMQSEGSEVRWFDAAGKQTARQIVYRQYQKGLHIAAADVTGDGSGELVVAQTAGPDIRAYDQNQKLLWNVQPLGKKFTAGWTIATGDFNGDGRWDVAAVANNDRSAPTVYIIEAGKVTRAWRMSQQKFSDSIVLGAGDLNGDGKYELLAMTTTGPALIQSWSGGGKLRVSTPLTERAPRSLGVWQ